MDLLTLALAKKGGGGASSWNDLADKPFYEETVEVGGDTLDFLTTDAEVRIDTLCKVSDVTPLDSDFVAGSVIFNGASRTTHAITTIPAADAGLPATGDIVLISDASGSQGFYGMVVRTEGATIAGMTAEVGLYIHSEIYKGYIKLPGYTGFVSKQTTIKTIDEKYLPDSVKGGGGGKTLILTATDETGENYTANMTLAEAIEAINQQRLISVIVYAYCSKMSDLYWWSAKNEWCDASEAFGADCILINADIIENEVIYWTAAGISTTIPGG